MREDRIKFELYCDKSPESKKRLREKARETDIWKIKKYLENEYLIEFEIDYGAKEGEEVIKLVGKSKDNKHLFNLSLKINKETEETKTKSYYNNFKEIKWDGEKPVVNGEEISKTMKKS